MTKYHMYNSMPANKARLLAQKTGDIYFSPQQHRELAFDIKDKVCVDCNRCDRFLGGVALLPVLQHAILGFRAPVGQAALYV